MQLARNARLGREGLRRGSGRQPLRLRLLRRILEAADREFLREAEMGLPVGILDPLPRHRMSLKNS